jgi:peptide/nickel transport system permease protein
MQQTEALETITVRSRLRQAAIAVRGIPIPAVIILFLLIICALFAGQIAPHDPIEQSLADAYTPPFWSEQGSGDHILGTDQYGRDILSRIIYGCRVSLTVSLAVVFLAGAIGTILALIAGYFGGIVDAIIMRLTDMMLSLPWFVLAIAVAAIVGPSLLNVILILVAVTWASYARVIRSEVLRIREADYVQLAKVAQANTARILIKHIFPNVANTLVVIATLRIGTAIIAEASLSFLGLGVPPPDPSWGQMLGAGRSFLATAWWIATFPGIAIMLTVLSANLLGDWLRVRLDPKQRQTQFR